MSAFSELYAIHRSKIWHTDASGLVTATLHPAWFRLTPSPLGPVKPWGPEGPGGPYNIKNNPLKYTRMNFTLTIFLIF